MNSRNNNHNFNTNTTNVEDHFLLSNDEIHQEAIDYEYENDVYNDKSTTNRRGPIGIQSTNLLEIYSAVYYTNKPMMTSIIIDDTTPNTTTDMNPFGVLLGSETINAQLIPGDVLSIARALLPLELQVRYPTDAAVTNNNNKYPIFTGTESKLIIIDIASHSLGIF